MKKSAVAVLILVAFLAGYLAGGLSNRQERVRSESDDRKASSESKTIQIPPTDLEQTVRRQSREITRLEETIRSLQAGHVPTLQDKLAIAKEIYEAFTRLANRDTEPDPDEFMKVLGRLDEVDSDMTAFFISKYEEARKNEKRGEEEEMVLFLILSAGGAEATGFLNRQLSGAAGDSRTREEMLRMLGGGGGPPISMSKIPMDQALTDRAYALVESTIVAERVGGAGLLSGRSDDKSRNRLKQILQSDTDDGVRAAAVRSLGRIGDRATLHYLQSQVGPATESRNNHRYKRALKGAIAQLENRLK